MADDEPEIELDIDVVPPMAYSIIQPKASWQRPLRVGWTNDGGCGLPLMDCRCDHLTEPGFVKRMREREQA